MTNFMRRGITRVMFLPSVADPKTAPTRAEMTAGKDLSEPITELSGFSSKGETVEFPSLKSPYDKKIPGVISTDDSVLTFAEDLDNEDIEEMFIRGTKGFIFILPKGDKPDSKSGELYPVEVVSNTRVYSMGADVATVEVTFSITGVPTVGCTIPAAQ